MSNQRVTHTWQLGSLGHTEPGRWKRGMGLWFCKRKLACLCRFSVRWHNCFPYNLAVVLLVSLIVHWEEQQADQAQLSTCRHFSLPSTQCVLAASLHQVLKSTCMWKEMFSFCSYMTLLLKVVNVPFIRAIWHPRSFLLKISCFISNEKVSTCQGFFSNLNSKTTSKVRVLPNQAKLCPRFSWDEAASCLTKPASTGGTGKSRAWGQRSPGFLWEMGK